MVTAAVSLGSNLGDRRRNLTRARESLGDLGEVLVVSPVYRTAPVGVEGHPEYLNAVAVIETDLTAQQLMRGLLAIEYTAGRTRGAAPMPRPIDLDLLLYGDEQIDEADLVVPHPRMLERRFVLQPLHDVWPDAPIPGDLALPDALAAVRDQAVGRAERGGRWVAMQALLAAAVLAAAIWDRGSLGLEGTWFEWVARALIAAGALQAILGLRHLGSQLTAFPEPIHRGRLVDSGIYGVVRHPLYGANVMLLAGVALHQNSSWAIVVAAVSAGFFAFKAVSEEQRLVFRYPEYRAYQEAVTARLIPFVF